MKLRTTFMSLMVFSLLVQGQPSLQIPMSEPVLPVAPEVSDAAPVLLPEAEPTVLPTPVPTATPKPRKVPGGVSVTVMGDRVNLRNDATTESEVVGQANYGDLLEVVSLSDAWVEVVPPEALNVWVYSPLLFEDKEVRAPEMNVRAGPGTQFARLGQLTRGTPVTVLESLGEWRRIEAPEAVTLWISRDFVQVPPSLEKPARPKVTPTPRPKPTPITIVEVRTIERIVEVPVAATPEAQPEVVAPEGLDLVPLRGQGLSSRRRGLVRAYLLAANNPSRFSLERPDGTGLCFLLGDEELLQSANGRMVDVSGVDFWVTGEKKPVMEVKEIKFMDERGVR